MKITEIETIQLAEFPNLLWLHIHTDEGLIGLGETFFGADAVAAYITKPRHPACSAPTLCRSTVIPARYSATIWGFPVPGPRCAARRQSTSPCGTSSAKPWTSRSTNCWAD